MKRTQIQLSEEDFERLRGLARERGRSMADCIREGILWFLQKAARQAEDLSRVPSFHARPFDDLKDHDRGWVEAISKGRDSGR